MDAIKVLLLGVTPMMRFALTTLVEQHLPGAQVLKSKVLGAEAPHVVVLDLHAPGSFEALQQIQAQNLLLPVLTIAYSEGAEDALQALGAGAMGYVFARSEPQVFAQALQLVLAGGTYVPPLQPQEAPSLLVEAEPELDLDSLCLTPRQKQVLTHLVQGLPNKLIAREMCLSVETVKDHVAALLKVFGVSTRTQVVVAAQKKAAQGGRV